MQSLTVWNIFLGHFKEESWAETADKSSLQRLIRDQIPSQQVKHWNREKVVYMLKSNTPKVSWFGQFAPAMVDGKNIQCGGGLG